MPIRNSDAVAELHPLSRSYCFTSFTPDVEPVFSDLVRYAIYQQELAPGTSRRHWQGYVEFHSPCRIPAAQRAIGLPGAHLEPRRGTRDQAREYCRKPESQIEFPVEYGTWESGGQVILNGLHGYYSSN